MEFLVNAIFGPTNSVRYGIVDFLTNVVGPGLVGVAAAVLAVSLAVGWVRRIRSAV